MSRSDFTPDQRASLDRFDAPQLRRGFADRVLAAATPALPRTASHDRRGSWKLVRRAVIGTVAAGMVSAAAVASGLLGAAGIRVPVLTAMLAPEPVPVAKPKQVARKTIPKKPVPVSEKSADSIPAVAESSAAPSMMPQRFAQAKARRIARRAERQAFIEQNPQLVPVIKQAFQKEREFVAANPAMRELRRLPRAERGAYLAERPELAAAIRTRQAERRAFRQANPEAETIIRTRIEQRREARRAGQDDSVSEGNSEPAR